MFALAAAFVLLSPIRSQSYRWDNVEIVGGGFVSGILFHPAQRDLIYARTDIGGAYRWNPRTHRWIPLVDWIQRPDWNLYGIESIGLDPSDPKRLYLASGTYTNEWAGNGAILRSDDQGRSFKRCDLPFKLGGNMDGRSMGERLAVDPNEGNILLFGTRSSGLWRSDDYAASWRQVESFKMPPGTGGIGIGFEVFDKRSAKKGEASQTIYAGVASKQTNLYRSTDGGLTWSPVPGQPAGLIPQHGAIDPGGNLILTYGNAPGPNGVTDGSVWKLDTASGEWTNISPVDPHREHGFGYAGLSVDPHRPGCYLVTTLDRWNPGDDVFRTSDGGKHWLSMKASAKMDVSGSPFLLWGASAPKFGWWMGCVQSDPFNPDRVLFGTGATIWGTDDATRCDRNMDSHWTVRAQGLEETAVIDLMSPPKGAHLFSALGDIGGFRHADLRVVPPEGMQSNPIFGNTDSVDFAGENPDVMVRVGRANDGFRRGAYSTDGGATWTPFATEPAGSRGSGKVAVSADGSTIVWAPSGSACSFSRDHGATWTASAGAPRNLQVCAGSGGFYGFDGRTGTVYVSTDGGASFEARASGLPTGESTIRAVSAEHWSEGTGIPRSSGTRVTVQAGIWLACGKSLYRSKDGGVSFAKLDALTDVSTFGFGKAAPGGKYPAIFLIGAIDGVEGAFRSDDEGKTWVCITDAEHGYGTMDHIVGDPRIYGRVYLGTNGRGVLFGDPKTR